MYTPKERLHVILQGEKADRPACICPGGMMNMVTSELMQTVSVYLPEAHMNAKKMAKLAQAVYDEKCFENYGVPFCMTIEAEEMGADVDLGSDICEPHVTKYVIDSVTAFNQLKPIDLSQGRAQVVLEAIRILKSESKGVPVIGNLTGPISTATSLMEPVTFYKQLRKKNAEAHAYMQFITEQLIRFGLAQIEAGADLIAISDPSGTGEILGPKLFQEFAVTYINLLVDTLREAGADTIVHICGQMSPVYQQVRQIHSHALSFDSVVSMREAKEQLAGRVIMGNVSTYALEFGEPSKIRQLTEGCVRQGADILSPACGLGMKSPLRNIQTILKSLTEEEE